MSIQHNQSLSQQPDEILRYEVDQLTIWVMQAPVTVTQQNVETREKPSTAAVDETRSPARQQYENIMTREGFADRHAFLLHSLDGLPVRILTHKNNTRIIPLAASEGAILEHNGTKSGLDIGARYTIAKDSDFWLHGDIYLLWWAF